MTPPSSAPPEPAWEGMHPPQIVWDPRERYVATVEHEGPFNAQSDADASVADRRPRLRVYEVGGKKRVFEGEGLALAMLGDPPVLLIDGAPLQEWNFLSGTTAVSRLAPFVPPGATVCVGYEARHMLIADGKGAITIKTAAGAPVELDTGSVVDPEVAQYCRFSADGTRLAIADAKMVGVFRLRDGRFTRERWFLASNASALQFGVDGRYVTARVDGSRDGEDSGFVAFDTATGVLYATWRYGLSGLTAKNEVVFRDSHDDWFVYALSGAAISGRARGTMGSRVHALEVSPRGTYAATVVGNWGNASLDLHDLR